MKTFRWIGIVLGTCCTIQYAYWGFMYAGAWLTISTPPTVTSDWLALGMFGAMFATGDCVKEQLIKVGIVQPQGDER